MARATTPVIMVDAPPLSRDLSRSELEAMFEAMFLAAFADDDFSDQERARFAERMGQLSGGHVQGERFDELLAMVTRELFTHGLEQRLASLSSRITDPKRRQLTLRAAADVASGDQLSGSERRLLEQLGKALELDDSSIRDVLA